MYIIIDESHINYAEWKGKQEWSHSLWLHLYKIPPSANYSVIFQIHKKLHGNGAVEEDWEGLPRPKNTLGVNIYFDFLIFMVFSQMPVWQNISNYIYWESVCANFVSIKIF